MAGERRGNPAGCKLPHSSSGSFLPCRKSPSKPQIPAASGQRWLPRPDVDTVVYSLPAICRTAGSQHTDTVVKL